jgi:adenylate cyclase
MTEVIFRWEGTLDKFVGDEIVAFWGAPLPQENHAELATRCALNMVEKLKELCEKWLNEGKAPLEAGFGLNTGEVIVGNIGAEGKKMDYTVIGDHVNLGARVEALTRKYSTNILITEFTLNKIKGLVKPKNGQIIGHVSVKGLERVTVKGKEKPVRIYEVKSLEPDMESRIIELEE